MNKAMRARRLVGESADEELGGVKQGGGSRTHRIAVVMPRLSIGGQERMRLKLIRAWRNWGFEVDLVVGWADATLVYQVPEGTHVVEIARRSGFFFPFGLLGYLHVRRPDHVFVAGYDAVAIALTLWRFARLRIPLVVSIHNHTTVAFKRKKGWWSGIRSRFALHALRHAGQLSRGVIAVSEGVAEDIRERVPELRHCVHAVNNPVVDEQTLTLSEMPLTGCPVPEGRPWIVFVGRLVPAKGVDLLVDAFAGLAKESAVDLVIVGDGEDREVLEKRVNAHGLSHRIHFVGSQLNPLPWMREAHALVLSSWHEGSPNVLVEAMLCGTQIVATDCPSGPRETLMAGRFGQLVPVGDIDELGNAIARAVSKTFWVEPQALRERAMRFSAKKSATRYLEIGGISSPVSEQHC